MGKQKRGKITYGYLNMISYRNLIKKSDVFYFSYYLRKAELINLLPKLTMTSFYYISIISFLFELAFFYYLVKYYLMIKKKKGNKIVLDWYPKFMFYINTIFLHNLI